jgi:hypothetical protein
LRPATLLICGNPVLGAQFITSNPLAGAYTDFQWIAHRHQVEDRDPAFGKASEVIASITASVTAR